MPLDHRFVSRDGPQDRLLLFVHGYAESSAMFTDRLSLIDPTGRYLAVTPDAPYEKNGRAIWHRAFSGEGGEAPEQFRQSLVRLTALIERLCAEHHLDPARTVVAGFSQGAGLAIGLTIAASPLPPVAGCLAFCGFAPPVPGLRIDRDRAGGVPVFLPVATNDKFVPLEVSRESAVLLAELGLLVTYHEAATGHDLTDDTATLAGAFLDALESGPPPPTALPAVPDGQLRAMADALWDW